MGHRSSSMRYPHPRSSPWVSNKQDILMWATRSVSWVGAPYTGRPSSRGPFLGLPHSGLPLGPGHAGLGSGQQS